jgi:hypothetical protein
MRPFRLEIPWLGEKYNLSRARLHKAFFKPRQISWPCATHCTDVDESVVSRWLCDFSLVITSMA